MKILHASDWHLGQKFICLEWVVEHCLDLGCLVQALEKVDTIY